MTSLWLEVPGERRARSCETMKASVLNCVRGSVAHTQVVDHALTKSSHGKLLSKSECSFGDKHYALLKGAFYLAKDAKQMCLRV